MSQLIIDGTYKSGLGGAAASIASQLPALGQLFPEIGKIYAGTINFGTAKPVVISDYDYTTPPIFWGVSAIEQFSFVRGWLEYPIGTPLRRAWFYLAHGSSWYPDPQTFEIICEHVGSIAKGAALRFHVERGREEPGSYQITPLVEWIRELATQFYKAGNSPRRSYDLAMAQHARPK